MTATVGTIIGAVLILALLLAAWKWPHIFMRWHERKDLGLPDGPHAAPEAPVDDGVYSHCETSATSESYGLQVVLKAGEGDSGIRAYGVFDASVDTSDLIEQSPNFVVNACGIKQATNMVPTQLAERARQDASAQQRASMRRRTAPVRVRA